MLHFAHSCTHFLPKLLLLLRRTKNCFSSFFVLQIIICTETRHVPQKQHFSRINMWLFCFAASHLFNIHDHIHWSLAAGSILNTVSLVRACSALHTATCTLARETETTSPAKRWALNASFGNQVASFARRNYCIALRQKKICATVYLYESRASPSLNKFRAVAAAAAQKNPAVVCITTLHRVPYSLHCTRFKYFADILCLFAVLRSCCCSDYSPATMYRW